MYPLLGTWLLTGTEAFDEAGQRVLSPFGTRPMGVVRFEADRMVGVVADGSPELPAGSPRRAFFSYMGNYQFDGERLVTHVDGASSPDGFTDQVRHVTFQGPDRIVVVPLTRVLDSSPGLELTWERIS